MATAAEILANRENAANSTGPKTEAGKAAAAQNATTHGLSGAFRLLSGENPAEFEALVAALTAETPTEHFLFNEMARAQWKLDRVAAIEAEIFAAAGDPAALAADSARQDALLKLGRYEQAARRAWHKTLEQLTRLRAAAECSDARQVRIARDEAVADAEQFMIEAMNLPTTRAAIAEISKTNPMPDHLRREFDALRRRDPLFDPFRDRSQMSKHLQKWFDRTTMAA